MSSDSKGIPRVNVLGVGISALNLSLATQAVDDALREKRKGYICVTGVHGVMESQQDAELKRIHNHSFLTTPDGMPMVWMGRRQGVAHMGRVYGPDLMLEVFRLSEQRGYKQFLYGGNEGVAEAMRVEMARQFPGLPVVGTYEPPFRPLTADEECDLIARVAAAKPDIMWIGLSTPKQERFMAQYLPKLDVTLMAGVGAAFNFYTKRVTQAPRWMQRSGLEWFYRFVNEPRLRPRYLSIVPRFTLAVLAQQSGLKKHELELNARNIGLG